MAEFPKPEDILPHRPPMLYLDEVTELQREEQTIRAEGLWTPPASEFLGHFPGHPVLPGVKTLESIAQTGAYAVLTDREDMLPLFTSADTKFTAMVFPGDTLENSVTLTVEKERKATGTGIARVAGNIVCTSFLSFVLVTQEKFFELAERQGR